MTLLADLQAANPANHPYRLVELCKQSAQEIEHLYQTYLSPLDTVVERAKNERLLKRLQEIVVGRHYVPTITEICQDSINEINSLTEWAERLAARLRAIEEKSYIPPATPAGPAPHYHIAWQKIDGSYMVEGEHYPTYVAAHNEVVRQSHIQGIICWTIFAAYARVERDPAPLRTTRYATPAPEPTP